VPKRTTFRFVPFHKGLAPDPAKATGRAALAAEGTGNTEQSIYGKQQARFVCYTICIPDMERARQ
jgi:hypothetical protein